MRMLTAATAYVALIFAVVLYFIVSVFAQPASTQASDRVATTIGRLVIETENKTDQITQLRTLVDQLTKEKAELVQKLEAKNAK